MIKAIVSICILSASSIALNAQDKLTLTTGKKIKGTITDYKQGEFVSVKTEDATLSFKSDEVKKIHLNTYTGGALKEKGFFNQTTIGGLFGNTEYGYRSGGFSMTSVNGYQFKKINVGAGFGIETWSGSFTFPTFATVQYFPLGNVQTSPFIGLSPGYNFGPESNNYYYPLYDCYNCYYSQSGTKGPMAGAEIGLRRTLSSNLAFILSSGLRYQYSQLKYSNYNGEVYTEDEHLFRFQLKFGIYFN